MQKIFIVCLLVMCFGFLQGQDVDARLKGIDTLLQQVLETWQAPGFAVVVVEKDKIVYSAGFGYRAVESKQKVTSNTLFQIGSCSKAFTSGLLGMLVEEGKVDLDVHPRTYIPYLKFQNEELDNFVLVRDLMRHSTGLPRHDYSWYLFPARSKDSLLMRVAHQEPFAHVREKWYYNNFMFLAQGVIAEKVTGKSWEENIKERFFQPLNMTRSNASIAALKTASDAAVGYQTMPDGSFQRMDYFPIEGMSPAGSLNSSVNEMANWLIMWINGGKYKGKAILPAAYIAEAMSSQMVITGALPDSEHPDIHFANYGLGWFLTSYKGHYRVEHGGNIDGFSASTCFFPSDSIGIVVLTNQNASSLPYVVRNILSDRMLNLTRNDWSRTLKSLQDTALAQQQLATQNVNSTKKVGTTPSHILEDFVGRYEHPGYGVFNLVVKGDSLIAEFPIKRFWLRHFHYDIFELLEITKYGIDSTSTEGTKASFTTNVVGDIASVELELEPSLEPIAFKRTPNKIEVTSEQLVQYVGSYSIGGAEVKIYTKNKNILYLFVAGQPEYELMATGKHKFVFKTLDGYSVEFLEEAEKITSVLLIQPNGTFKAIKKE